MLRLLIITIRLFRIYSTGMLEE